MLFDRQFLHHVDDWLDRQKEDFGGLDALCLWQAYPRIGIDRRNQFDHYREFPGGSKPVVDHLHANGVKVVLAYNPWDVGTRREGKSDADAMAEMVGGMGFDGIFLDTLTHGAAGLRQTIDKAKPGVVLESELALPLDAVDEHHASWAQWFDDSQAPGVMRNKWFEQRHQMHTIRRWDLDHSAELQMSWMNGAGIFVWQNIFGSWNGWSDRVKSILRAMLPVQRRYWPLQPGRVDAARRDEPTGDVRLQVVARRHRPLDCREPGAEGGRGLCPRGRQRRVAPTVRPGPWQGTT